MKVFVVLEITKCCDYEYCGVYGTREKAEARIVEIKSEFNTDGENLYIEEVDV